MSGIQQCYWSPGWTSCVTVETWSGAKAWEPGLEGIGSVCGEGPRYSCGALPRHAQKGGLVRNRVTRGGGGCVWVSWANTAGFGAPQWVLVGHVGDIILVFTQGMMSNPSEPLSVHLCRSATVTRVSPSFSVIFPSCFPTSRNVNDSHSPTETFCVLLCSSLVTLMVCPLAMSLFHCCTGPELPVNVLVLGCFSVMVFHMQNRNKPGSALQRAGNLFQMTLLSQDDLNMMASHGSGKFHTTETCFLFCSVCKFP